MNPLLELADRVEAATGPDRELDAEIFDLVAGGMFWPETQQWWLSGTTSREPIVFTASLDAATKLVPEGYPWSVNTSVGRAWILPPGDYLESLRIGNVGDAANSDPALALTAASLRAIASMGSSG